MGDHGRVCSDHDSMRGGSASRDSGVAGSREHKERESRTEAE